MASVDYYHGQSLDEIALGDEDWQWALVLNGGAVIKNWDKRRTDVPEIPKGTGLLTSILEADATTLVFGTVDPATLTVTESGRVVFTPTQYSISDPVYAAEEEFPQRQTEMVAESPEVVYPEHLLAREATGPENQEDEIAPEGEDSAEDRQSTADEDDA